MKPIIRIWLAKELIEAKEREPDQITIGLLVFKHQELSYNSSYLCEEYKNLELVSYMANNKIAWVCRFHDDNNSSVIESDTLEGLKARIREFFRKPEYGAFGIEAVLARLNTTLPLYPSVYMFDKIYEIKEIEK